MHKGHSLEHLHTVYKAHRASIDAHAQPLYSRLNEYRNLESYFDDLSLSVTQKKQAMLESLRIAWQESADLVDRQDTRKQAAIAAELESKALRQTLDALEGQLASSWQTDIISNTERIIDMIKKIPPRDISDYHIQDDIYTFESNLIPNYESGVFIIHNFKTLQQSPSPAFSEPIWASGLTWRLKVYPSGNGVCRNECMSVFVELLEGTPIPSKYQYKIEMIHPNTSHDTREQRKISREFTSEFSVGECWGYNRFYSLDAIEREGFHDPSLDCVHLVYHIRAPTYELRSRDLAHYISSTKSTLPAHLASAKRIETATTETAATSAVGNVVLPSDSAVEECDITELGERELSIEQPTGFEESTDVNQDPFILRDNRDGSRISVDDDSHSDEEDDTNGDLANTFSHNITSLMYEGTTQDVSNVGPTGTGDTDTDVDDSRCLSDDLAGLDDEDDDDEEEEEYDFQDSRNGEDLNNEQDHSPELSANRFGSDSDGGDEGLSDFDDFKDPDRSWIGRLHPSISVDGSNTVSNHSEDPDFSYDHSFTRVADSSTLLGIPQRRGLE
eukprot:jgi/Hompol1/6491/HPOL_000781-RA